MSMRVSFVPRSPGVPMRKTIVFAATALLGLTAHVISAPTALGG
jgi:hypothetical protein